MDVEAFIDGDWTNDFLQVAELIKQDKEHRNQQLKDRLESEKIEKLKQDFGIS